MGIAARLVLPGIGLFSAMLVTLLLFLMNLGVESLYLLSTVADRSLYSLAA
ncbi:hypothetical protein ACIA74_27010 [Streptomyces sp. NPDC051658]|uniref:hypothetical protein n=1 Tax=unclassified Streptomyces TaxID=2593676 RepID=UPI0036DFE17C